MAAVRGFSLSKISKIRISFSTFDSRVASTRELLRRLSSSKLRETNPKCEVIVDIHGSRRIEPTVDVTLSDGSSLNFNCVEHKALDMIAEINKRSKTLA